MNKKYLTATALTLGALAVVSQASAAPLRSVGDKLERKMEAKGSKIGDFVVIPKVDSALIYDDNIYATDSNTDGDTIMRIRPSVEGTHKGAKHTLSALARLDYDRNFDKKTESTSGYLFSGYGSREITKDAGVNGKAQYSRRFEDRGDPNTPANAAKPIAYNFGLARVGGYYDWNKWAFKASSELQDYDFHDSFTNAGALIDSDVRDRTHYIQKAEAAYKLNAFYTPFVRGTIDNRVYDSKGPTVNRSSDGGSVVVGSELNLRSNLKGSAYAGWMSRDYSPSLKDINTLAFGGDMTWNMDEKTSVIGRIDRSIEETTRTGSSGIVATSYNADIEHVPCENVLVSAGLGYGEDSYEGPALLQREDDIYSARAGAKYFISRGVAVNGDYSYRDRDSNISGGDYSRHMVVVGLSLSY